MSEQNASAPASRRNPLIWIVLVVVGLIVFVFVGGDRRTTTNNATAPVASTDVSALPLSANDSDDNSVPVADSAENSMTAAIDESIIDESTGTITRNLLVPPGMRARQYIQELREAGKPFPLSQVFDRAKTYQQEGSLADAHLLFFFAARENHLPAMMIMGEMSDPLYFDAANSLLDEASAIQAFKWYSQAADLGEDMAVSRLDQLAAWADGAAAAGDAEASQLLLNIK